MPNAFQKFVEGAARGTAAAGVTSLLQGGFNPVASGVLIGASILDAFLDGDDSDADIPGRTRLIFPPIKYKRLAFGYFPIPLQGMFGGSFRRSQLPNKWLAALLDLATEADIAKVRGEITTKQDFDFSVADYFGYLSHDQMNPGGIRGIFLDNDYVPLTNQTFTDYSANDPLMFPVSANINNRLGNNYFGRLLVTPIYTRPALPTLSPLIDPEEAYRYSLPAWYEDYHLTNISYARVSFIETLRDNTRFWRDKLFPSQIQLLAEGVKVYDLSKWTSGGAHLTAPRVWTNNAVAIWYFFEKQFAKTPESKIDFHALLDSYNYAEEIIEYDWKSYTKSGAVVTQGQDSTSYTDRMPARDRRYTFNGMITTERPNIQQIRKRFEFACNGRIVPSGNAMAMLAGKERAPTSVHFTDKDFMEPPKRIVQPDVQDAYNAVRVRYKSQMLGFRDREILVKNKQAIERDGQEVVKRGVLVIEDYPSDPAVKKLVVTELISHDNNRLIEAPVIGIHRDLRVGDVLTFSCTELEIDSRRYELADIEYDLKDNRTKFILQSPDNAYADRFDVPPLEAVPLAIPEAYLPTPTGITATGLVRGVYLSRSESDLRDVPDYKHTLVDFTYTPTGGQEKTVTRSFSGTDHSFYFEDVGENDQIAFAMDIYDVAFSGKRSGKAEASATSESLSVLAGSFGNGSIGARFVYDDYRQTTPAESPPDQWDKSSWNIYNAAPPTPAVTGLPLTRTLFENMGRSGQGGDLFILNNLDKGDVSLSDFADDNSERGAGNTFPKFRNTLVKVGASENYWAIYRISYLQYATIDGTLGGKIYSLWFRPVLVYAHFAAPYPTFGDDAGEPTLTMDFQLSRGERGETGQPGATTETLFRLLDANEKVEDIPIPSNTRKYKEAPTPDDGNVSVRPSITPQKPILAGIDRSVSGRPSPGDTPTADWGGWDSWYVIEEFGKDSKNIEFAFAGNTKKIAPIADNPDNRFIDGHIPTGFSKNALSISYDLLNPIYYVFGYIRRKTGGTPFNRTWSDWSGGFLMFAADIVPQEFYALAPRGYTIVEWMVWDAYSREDGIETVQPGVLSNTWIRSQVPPVPGAQYGNSPPLPQRIIEGAVSADTPAGFIETTSKLFRLRVRFKMNESDDWNNEDGVEAIPWAYGKPSAGLIAFADTIETYDVVCTQRAWIPEKGAFGVLPPPQACGIVDKRASLPVGGSEGQVPILDADGNYYPKSLETTDVKGLEPRLVALEKAGNANAYAVEFSNVTLTAMTVKVTSGPTSGNYRLQYRESNTGGWVQKAAQASNTFVLSPLKANTTYEVQVVRGSGNWSVPFTHTTARTAPATAPRLTGDLTFGGIRSDGFVVDWNDATGTFQEYRIFLDDTPHATVTASSYSFHWSA